MSTNQFTGTATQPQCNRNETAHFVNLIRTSTVPLDYGTALDLIYQYLFDSHCKKMGMLDNLTKF